MISYKISSPLNNGICSSSPLPAGITSVLFTWLHLLLAVAFLSVVSPSYVYSLLFQAFSSCRSPVSSAHHWLKLGASDLRGLGAGRRRQETCGKVSSRRGSSFEQDTGFLQEFKALEQHNASAIAIFLLLDRDSPPRRVHIYGSMLIIHSDAF